MEEKMTRKLRTSVAVAVFFILILGLFFGCGYFSYSSMQKSLYEERTNNVSVLMEKTTQNVERAIETQWSTIYYFHNMFDALTPAEGYTLSGAQTMLERLRESRPDDAIGFMRLFLITQERECYFSNGSKPWIEAEATTNFVEDNCFISDTAQKAKPEEFKEPHMLFVSPFPSDAQPQIEGKTFVAMAMTVDMSFISSTFDTRDFGADSVAFIVDRNGGQLYRQSKESPLSAETDVVRSLVNGAEFTQGVKAEKFETEIATGGSGCVFVRYGKGQGYYVTYRALDVKNGDGAWEALLLIPYANVSIGSQEFVVSIILSTLAIAVGIVAVVLFIIFFADYRVRNQLRSAAEAERSANLAKTQFLSAMSHDIRTPMNGIVGMTTLASKRLDEKEYVKNCLSKISLASSHLLTLINDILDITKIETGKMSLNPIHFSLTDTVSNLINVIRPLAHEKLHKFEFRVHNIRIENVYADQLRLNQILINLLSNAVKYTPEGGRINVDLREDLVEDNPDVVRLTYIVEDNGMGMSEEFQKTMYRSFTREEQITAQKIQGSGLGLTICKQMVELMGGAIECESMLGAGTRFTVKVDLLIGDKKMEELIFNPTEVLLVDDDPVFLLSATDTLLQLGLMPDCVDSGEAAVQAVERRHEQGSDYPLVIVDWQMPEMDGVETVRKIREKVGEEAPIIVGSAYNTEAVEEEARAIGVKGFIAKPFFRSTVYERLKPLLESGEVVAQEEEVNPLRGMRVLVAEDNELNWEIAKDLLEMYGVVTVRAENGQACVDIMRRAEDGDYDLILMDIQMPILDGYGATKALRKSNRKYLKEIPIIAMTADAFSENIKECMRVGMNAHIAKPVDVNVLVNVLQSWRGGGA